MILGGEAFQSQIIHQKTLSTLHHPVAQQRGKDPRQDIFGSLWGLGQSFVQVRSDASKEVPKKSR